MPATTRIKPRGDSVAPVTRLGELRGRLSGAKCRRIDGLPGPEDIVIDNKRGIAYVSSQLRDSGSASQINGDIFGLDLKVADPKPVSMTGTLNEEIGFFHPHGIDLLIGEGETSRLFAINHRSEDSHSIEIFDIKGGAMDHVRRITNDRFLTSPNDLVAVSKDRFFVANDHGYRSKGAQTIEEVLLFGLKIRLGTVVEGMLTDDGATFTRVADHIGFPAGIEVDNRSAPTRLYVAAAQEGKIRVYDRDGDGWSSGEDIDLEAGPDNLTWDQKGRLWVAAHPDLHALGLYLKGYRQKAPSRVWCIGEPDTAGRVTEPPDFSDDGDLIAAASVAALYEHEGHSRLLIGAPRGHHVLLCDLL